MSPVEDGQKQPCPRCTEDSNDLPEEPWKLGIHAHKYVPSTLSPVPPQKIGVKDTLRQPTPMDSRLPCDLLERPSEEAAQQAGILCYLAQRTREIYSQLGGI